MQPNAIMNTVFYNLVKLAHTHKDDNAIAGIETGHVGYYDCTEGKDQNNNQDDHLLHRYYCLCLNCRRWWMDSYGRYEKDKHSAYRWDHQPPRLANAHALHTNIPTLDDLLA